MSCASSGDPAGELDEHAVHAAAVLDVEVAVEHRTLCGLEALVAAECDVLLQASP